MNWLGRGGAQTRRFDDQFSGEGDALTYRKYGTGAAYRLNAAEKQDLRSAFRRTVFLSYAGVALLVVLAIGLVAWLDAQPGVETQAGNLVVWQTAAAIVPALAIFVWVQLRAMSAPERNLPQSRRTGPPLDRAARRKLALSRVTYGQLAVTTLVPLYFLTGKWSIDPLHGRGRLWWLFAATAWALLAFQAYRKWRFNARRSDETDAV